MSDADHRYAFYDSSLHYGKLDHQTQCSYLNDFFSLKAQNIIPVTDE